MGFLINPFILGASGGGGSPETPTYVRGAHAEGASVDEVVFSSNNAGDLLVASIWSHGGAVTTGITDTAGNTWVLAASVLNGAGEQLDVFYVASCVASAGANTLIASGMGGFYFRLNAVEYDGVAASSPVRTTATNSGTGTTAAAGNMTVVSGDLILGVIQGQWDNDNFSAGSGYTKRVGGGRDGVVEKLAASTTENASATGSSSGAWTAVGVAFKPGP